MKTQNRSATKTTKAAAKDAKPTAKVVEQPYSLVGVENMASVKGACLRMDGEEAARILEHVQTKYPHLPLAKNVVLRLVDERKNAVLLKATDGVMILRRTSDLFQTPTPILSEASRAEAKEAKRKATKERTAPSVGPRKGGAKVPAMLAKAIDEAKDRAAKTGRAPRVKVPAKVVRAPKAMAAPATAPAASPAPATVAAASPVVQG